ncbi:Hypothetical protein BFF97_01447 [Corynebacterium pseudotuberculosis]|nr:Hypothetical protein BFF97_01447 [Corynebacterium pseudotuberculosis]
MIQISDEHFEKLVDQALSAIPESITEHITNLAILIKDYAEDSPYILGLYHGVALTERSFDHAGFLPDTITIYKEALKILFFRGRTRRAGSHHRNARDRPLFWPRGRGPASAGIRLA